MDTEHTILALAALAQHTRLEAFRLLMRSEPHGVPAGELARALAVPHNTMSSHLAVLAQAGLVTAERRSRSILYRAEVKCLGEVLEHLVNECCGGRPELCRPLTMKSDPCCSPAEPADV